MKREETNNVFNEIESANDQNRIQNVCNTYGDRLRMPEKSYRSQFMVDSIHRVAYCRHGKVFWIASNFIMQGQATEMDMKVFWVFWNF